MSNIKRVRSGFTIIELLIVIVVIAILAGVTLVYYNGAKTRAIDAKIKSDFAHLSKAINMAQAVTNKPLGDIIMPGNPHVTGEGGGVAAMCVNYVPAGEDLAKYDKNSRCWQAYLAALDKISEVSETDVREIVDPWGRPYAIENRSRSNNCEKDVIWVYSNPINKWSGRYKFSELTLRPERPDC